MKILLTTRVKSSFISKFNTNPIMVFSPGRINIIGEHTDYNEGFVFPAAIDMGIYVAMGRSDSDKSTVHALDMEESFDFSVSNLKVVETGSWKNYIIGIVSEIQKAGKLVTEFNAVFIGDIPGGAGLSSSAALENSMVFGLNELFNLGLSKSELILISQKAEHSYVGVKCGIMDQYASMFGVKKNALLLDCRTVKSKPYPINFEKHQLVLINTNVKHSLSDSAYNDRHSVCESIAEMLNVKALRDVNAYDLEGVKDQLTPENYQKALYVIQENNRVVQASKAIEDGNLKLLGELIYASHEGLQHQYKVSCEELDFLVEQAKSNGHVLGARMMGGGFGGCTINLVAKEHTETFTSQVTQAYKNTFKKACSIYFVELSNGTQIIA